MSDIILCQPKSGMDIANTVAPPHSLLCVAAPLERAGYNVKIIDQRTNSKWKEDLLDELDTHPIYVGITCMVGTSVKFAIELAELIRWQGGTPIVWGGALPTIIPQQFIDSGLADYVFQREVDETVVELTRKIANKTQVERIVDSELPDMEKLLPEPYHLIDVEHYIHPDMYVKNGRMTMDIGQTSRRCPYHCVVAGTSINTPNHSKQSIEHIYDKNVTILGYENEDVVNNQIVYGDESIAEDIIEIEIEDGRKLVLTPNHQVLTKRGWIEAGNLLETDEVLTIVTPSPKREFKKCEVCDEYKQMGVNSKYCSRVCHDKSQIKKKQIQTCKLCGKQFIARWGHRKQTYCSLSCSASAKNKNRGNSNFAKLAKSNEWRERSRQRMLNNNPMKNPLVISKMVNTIITNHQNVEMGIRLKNIHLLKGVKHKSMSEESKVKMRHRMKCNNPMFDKKIVQKSANTHKKNLLLGKTLPKHRNDEQKEKYRLSKLGDKNPLWRGGYKDDYEKFSRTIREKVRERDGFICQLCGKTQFEEILNLGSKLECHHVDYNKKHSDMNNLIALCSSCHTKTGVNREYWIEYITNLLKTKYEIKEELCLLSGKK